MKKPKKLEKKNYIIKGGYQVITPNPPSDPKGGSWGTPVPKPEKIENKFTFRDYGKLHSNQKSVESRLSNLEEKVRLLMENANIGGKE